jgi:hypothetical protein
MNEFSNPQRNASKHAYHHYVTYNKTDLPPILKSIILETSALRHREYHPEKVQIRTEFNYESKDPKQVSFEKAQRQEVGNFKLSNATST